MSIFKKSLLVSYRFALHFLLQLPGLPNFPSSSCLKWNFISSEVCLFPKVFEQEDGFVFYSGTLALGVRTLNLQVSQSPRKSFSLIQRRPSICSHVFPDRACYTKVQKSLLYGKRDISNNMVMVEEKFPCKTTVCVMDTVAFV